MGHPCTTLELPSKKAKRIRTNYRQGKRNSKRKKTTGREGKVKYLQSCMSQRLHCYGCFAALLLSPITAALPSRFAKMLVFACAASCSSRACNRSCARATKAGTAASVRNTRGPKVTCCCFECVIVVREWCLCVCCVRMSVRGDTGQRSSSHSLQAFWGKQWKASDEIACSYLFTA